MVFLMVLYREQFLVVMDRVHPPNPVERIKAPMFHGVQVLGEFNDTTCSESMGCIWGATETGPASGVLGPNAVSVFALLLLEFVLASEFAV